MTQKISELTDELAAAQACDNALMRRRTVQALTGLRETTLNSLIERGQFPAPAFRSGQRIVRWRAGDVLRWLRAQAGGTEA